MELLLSVILDNLCRGCTELGIVVGAPIALKLSGGNCGRDEGNPVSCDKPDIRALLGLLFKTLVVRDGRAGGAGTGGTDLDFS